MILRNKLLKSKTKAGSSLLRLCLLVQKHSWKPDSVVNTIYFSAEAVTPAHGPADNQELDKMFRLKYSNVTPDKPHDCSYEVTWEHARGEPHHTGTQAEGRKCASELQQRRWWQLYVRGSESSAHPALRFKTTFQKTRWQKPKFSSNVSRLCLWNVLCLRIWEMLLLCWSHADAGQPHFWSSHFHALVPPGVILLGFSPRWQILFPWDKPQSEDDRLLCGSKPTVHRRYIAY